VEINRLALDSGVKPSELSGIITHLAFYAGWESAMSAVAATRPVFVERNISADQLAPAQMQLLPRDEKGEAERAVSVNKVLGDAAPAPVRDTSDVLFHELWLRPDLTPRDRSLVTMSALIATGQRGQPVPDRRAAEPTAAQLVAPGDQMRAGHGAEFRRTENAGEAHEVLHRVFVRAAGVPVADVGEPLDLGRHVGEFLDSAAVSSRFAGSIGIGSGSVFAAMFMGPPARGFNLDKSVIKGHRQPYRPCACKVHRPPSSVRAPKHAFPS
jgi:alkylhydroperoxidase/carboxymuconolactone decarboxylase family protein YurZ